MSARRRIRVKEHIVEIVSDSGEGAQKAAVCFAEASAMMGNGLWTVEVIPSEIQPPPHTTGATSGNRIRLAESAIANAGDFANVVLAFNEMALLSRIEAGTVGNDALVLIEEKWANHAEPAIRRSYHEVLDGVRQRGGSVVELPMEAETLKIVDDARRGANMWALGVLGSLYDRDLDMLRHAVAKTFATKAKDILRRNLQLMEAGYGYGTEHLDRQYVIAPGPLERPHVVMNGNTAIALGAIAAGFKICSMYPITPATSASHTLSQIFESFGGIVHQAEDEIAAIGVALGANYAGISALTITSGPGMALKTEFQGLAAMTETPLVIVDVQRGGPSTGLPTKIEQSDLLHALYGAPGDAPKIVLAPSTVEECFEVMGTARRLGEEFRMPVIVLSDANLATGQQLFPRPALSADALPPPPDQSPVPPGTRPFDWDATTGLSRRVIPGQPGGTSVITGLNHARDGKVGYDAPSNQEGHRMRSRKLATLQKVLRLRPVYGEDSGDLLVVGWGSTRGAIEEAVDRARTEGASVSALNLQFLNPLPRGLKNTFSRFRKVMTIELNYSDEWGDPLIDEESRRYGQLAVVLRAQTLVDVDCWTRVPGQPLRPNKILKAIQAMVPKGDA